MTVQMIGSLLARRVILIDRPELFVVVVARLHEASGNPHISVCDAR